MKDNTKWIFVLMLLAVIIFYSCSSFKSMQRELSDEYEEKIQDIKSYYYQVYESILDEYGYLYYSLEDSPDNTLPLERFTHPDDLRFPLKDYRP